MVAPNYPGYGQSAAPDHTKFAYSFKNFANIMDKLVEQLGIEKFPIYVMDHGAPVGYRLALLRPERIQAMIAQNGNAYEEALRKLWDGVADTTLLDPTTWLVDQPGMDRPGNREIQLDLLYDYRTNVPLYPEFQAFFRQYQPPTLIVWGKNDYIFPPDGAVPYARDLQNVETHLLDTGHFAFETHSEEIASALRDSFRRTNC